MNAIQVISLTLLSVLAANAQVIMPGRCPKPAVQEKFDAARVNTKPFTIYIFFFKLLNKSNQVYQDGPFDSLNKTLPLKPQDALSQL